MANKSISQLTAGSAVSGTDLFPDVQTAGVGPVKVTATQLATFFWYQPTLVAPSLGAATATSINIGGATLGTNVLAVNGTAIMTSLALGGATIGTNNFAVTGTTLLGGATTVSSGGLTVGVAGTTGGTIALKGSTAGTLTLQVPATVTDYSLTLPGAVAAGNGYILTSTTGGVTSWTNPTALGIDLDVGTTAITAGTSGRVLYDNAGVLGEYTVTGTAGSVVLSTGPTFTNAITLGTQQSVQGSIVLANTAAGAFATTLQASNSASAAWTLTLPVSAGTNGFILTTNGSGVTSWTNPTALGIDLDIGSTAITNGTTTRVLYDNAGVLSEASTLTVDTTSGKVSVVGASFGLSGNISAAAWTTNGIRYQNSTATLTDTTSSGTVAAAYSSLWGGNTIAATNVTTFTNYYSVYFGAPAAGSNVTLTNAWSIGTGGHVSVGGNLYTTTNSLVGGTAVRGTTVGTAHLDLFDGTAPVGTLTNGISLYSSSGDFHFMDSAGNAYKVGYRNIPQNSQTSAYVAVVGDVGKHISITTGGVTVNASVFSAGDVFTIYNNSGSSQNITAGSGVTFRLAGTATSGTPRTVAQYGLATVLCVTGGASPVFVLSGAGVA